jgi:hypothetical protein
MIDKRMKALVEIASVLRVQIGIFQLCLQYFGFNCVPAYYISAMCGVFPLNFSPLFPHKTPPL